MDSLQNIRWLGMKELRSIMSDWVMLLFVIYAFTASVFITATGTSTEVNNASIAFVDEDNSALSKQLITAFYPPRFQYPQQIQANEVETAMDQGRFMFAVTIPPNFESDLRAGRSPDIQLSIDATAMQQAGIGSGYIKNIINDKVASFLSRSEAEPTPAINLDVRRNFNPNGDASWFMAIITIINQITLLTIILTGASVIREREHGTLEHLLVLPINSFEIVIAKVWANSLVILIATVASLYLVAIQALHVPFNGSFLLWFSGVLLYLFFVTALGVFLGTISGSMAQFSLLAIMVILAMQLLSGGNTPIQSQPDWLQAITFFMPSRHFIAFSQVIIYRGGGFAAVWQEFVMVAAVGFGFFLFSLRKFRASISVSK